jgi:hypothetical protein
MANRGQTVTGNVIRPGEPAIIVRPETRRWEVVQFFAGEQRKSVGNLLAEAEAALGRLREHPGDKQATRDLQHVLANLKRLNQLQSGDFKAPDKAPASGKPVLPSQGTPPAERQPE